MVNIYIYYKGLIGPEGYIQNKHIKKMANDSKSLRKNTEKVNETTINKKRSKSLKNKEETLPWWVELLFVQLGLPEKLLTKILKTNKDLRKLIEENNGQLKIIFLVIICFLYINPAIQKSRYENRCIQIGLDSLKSNKTSERSNSGLPYIVNYCNGGRYGSVE